MLLDNVPKIDLRVFAKQVGLALESEYEKLCRRELFNYGEDDLTEDDHYGYQITIRYCRTGKYSPEDEERLIAIGENYPEIFKAYIEVNASLN